MRNALRRPLPIRSCPHGLWSLGDLMLKKAALELGRALAQLAQLEMSCETARRLQPHVLTDETGTLRRDATQILGNLRRVCILSDLSEVLPEIDRFGGHLTDNRVRIEDVKGAASHLKYRLFDELENEHYLQVDRREVQFYDQDALFGIAASKKFRKASYDIKNAGNCLALQQPTASVLHLNRALEVTLRHLGRRLKVPIRPKDTFGKILNNIDPKINAMPEKTEAQKRRRERWAEARANLFHVKQAWRDNSMHPKTSYSRQHAYDIFVAVRTFIAHLATL